MKNLIKFCCYLSFAIFLLSCEEKPRPPAITTSEETDVTTTSAVTGGNITDDGGAPIISKGVCWNITDNPTFENNRTSETGASTTFSSNLTQLSPKTLYFVRAYATNSAGTGYGESVSFTTLGDTPVSVAGGAINIALDSAIIYGTVNPNSLSTTISFEWGLTTDYGSTVNPSKNPVTGNTSVSVRAKLTGLSPGTTYHFRIKAENSLGTTYSGDITFTTLGNAPSVTIKDVADLQVNAATLNGSVNPNYLSTEVIFEWGTTTQYGNIINALQSPITGNTLVNVSTDLTGLAAGTTYHFRIVAINESGITNSNDTTFTTLGKVPAISSEEASDIQVNTASLNGSVNPNYLTTTVVFEWGTTTQYENTITALQSPLTGSTPINVSADLTGLAAGTTYHFRIVATNESGITNGNDTTFTTLGRKPAISSQEASDIQVNTASLNGSVNPNYLPTTVVFEWGTTTGYGNTIPARQSPVTGSSIVNVDESISGLTEGTTYHFRIKATNELGTIIGSDSKFTTLDKPIVATAPISEITSVSAKAGGIIISDFGSAITERGICWSTNPDPSTSDNKVIGESADTVFSGEITGLTPNTTYYLRAYAINSIGTGYGDELLLKTYTGSVTDIDENVYFTVTIGGQIWMVENLKTTKYKNGELIGTTVPANLNISAESAPKYQWPYDGDESNINTYGRLYTWHAITDTRGICPTGWHVPSESEQMILTSFLGGPEIAGGKLKESSATNWLAPNTGADNSSGFTALPGGIRYSWGQYLSKGSIGFFWSASERDITTGKDLYVNSDSGAANHGSWDKNFGFSLRCLKD